MLTDFLWNISDFDVFQLRGYAGTGKTSLIAAFVKSLHDIKLKSRLMAPTGRAAKVLSQYSGKRASTIHRSIYFINSGGDGVPHFRLGENKGSNTIFIVDEASMVSTFSGISDKNALGPRDLLQDLLEYVYSGTNCKLIFVGDVGQLPPVGMPYSPALNPSFMQEKYGFDVKTCSLTEIVRQEQDSGILDLSLLLRDYEDQIPQLPYNGTDVHRIHGMHLQDELESAYAKYGEDNVMIVTRSNKQANQYNQQIRVRIRWMEEELNAGDVIMAVHNNYHWLEPKSEAGFIANGEMMEIKKIIREEELFGFRFADVVVRFQDYPEMGDVDIKVMLDVIHHEGPNMDREKLKQLFYRIASEEYGYVTTKRERNKKVMENDYFQAIQIKFGYAVTCHKSQGGQWDAVFVDHGYFTEEMWNNEYMRWLYTAVTRAKKELYLVNFSPAFVGEED